jgi:hypothetical protein
MLKDTPAINVGSQIHQQLISDCPVYPAICVYFIANEMTRHLKEHHMKNTFSVLAAISALIVITLACNMSTANMSSLKISTDKEGKQETTTFKPGETIYAVATISNSPGKTTTKFRLKADDVPGTTKGYVIPGSEVQVELPAGGGTAMYSLPIPASAKGGTFTLEADMHDEKDEKKDGKASTITIG